MVNQNDKKFLKWNEWLNTLNNEICNLFSQREMFNEVQEIIKNNPLIKPNHFSHNMAMWYSAYMSITTRKLADEDTRVISYHRLLKAIKENPQVISRTRFLKMFADSNYPAGLSYKT